MRVPILHVVSLLAFVMSALGDDSVATSPRVCTIKLVDNGTDMYGTLGNMASSCFSTDVEHFKELKSLEDHKTFFKNICDKTQQIHECLAEVELKSEVCQNATSHQNLKLLLHLFETTLESGCVADGEVLASMVTTYKASPSDPFHSDPFRDCVSAGLARLLTNYIHDDVAIPSEFYVRYRSVDDIRDCIGHVAGGDVNLMTQLRTLLSEIINKMKCVHPEDGTTVLCKTIDVTLPDVPRLCPIKSHNEERTTVYKILRDQVSWCLFSSILHPDTPRRFGEIADLDMAEAFVKHHCRKKNILERCFSDVLASSRACLNEIQQNFIKVAINHRQKPIDYACIDDGRYLGYVITEVLRKKNETVASTGAIRECVYLAGYLDEGLHNSLDAEKVLSNYRRLEVLKECFINKMRGNNTVVLFTLGLINPVQRHMKCIDEQTGNIVLCETIDNTPETGNKVCPLVGDHENEPPEYDLLIDREFKCVNVATSYFKRLVDFTTIDEFRTFFSTFCHNHLDMKHCVEDITSLSKICQNQTNHQMLSLFSDFLGTTLEAGCKQDGEVLATIAHGFMTGAVIDRQSMFTCLENHAVQVKSTRLNIEGLSSESLAIYRAFESMKRCFTPGNEDVDTYKTLFVSFVNDILGDMKCIHPDDGTTVLCQTIIN